MAAEPRLGPDGPPLTYRLAEVTVRMVRSPGRSVEQPLQLTLSGTGRGTLGQGSQQRSFTQAPQELGTLLNALYRMHFFNLPANSTIRHSVVLQDDGTVQTTLLRMVDAASTRVCFAVKGYEKCVTFGAEGPARLEQLVERSFTEADRLAAPAAATK